jgi:FAD:protein FMN transferase
MRRNRTGRKMIDKLKILGILLLICAIIFSLFGCDRKKYQRYTHETLRAFGTVITLIAYAENPEKFNEYAKVAEELFIRLHQEFDIYHEYEGINNLKTVNGMAGKEPVPVSREIIDLLVFSKQAYYLTKGKVNIALGSVLRLWHDEMVQAVTEPLSASTPMIGDLQEESLHTNIEDLIIDEKNGTVYIRNPKMTLNVGAVAKGFAVERVARELEKMGIKSCILSAGGSNLKLIGSPMVTGRTKWAIGIQDPDADLLKEQTTVLDTVYLSDTSFVTSGDYQRFYYVGEQRYHHIIDPITLYPAGHYRAVIVVYPDGALADAFSTALFIMNMKEGKQLISENPGLEVAWILEDGEIQGTDVLIHSMKIRGNNQKDR